LHWKNFHVSLNGSSKGGLFPIAPTFDRGTVPETLFIADGGLRYLENGAPYKHIWWIGDGDSLPKNGLLKGEGGTGQWLEEIQSHHAGIRGAVLLPASKDLSDFAALLEHIEQELAPSDCPFIEIFNGLGGRSDHEAINVSEASFFLKKYRGVVVFHPDILVTNVPVSFVPEKERPFSILPSGIDFPFEIEIRGAVYSGNISLLRPSHGLSNRSTGGKCVELDPKNGVCLIIMGE
jgi:thiamine pyrophosphokinase